MASDKKIALEVRNVNKSFRLPTEQASGIKQAFINRVRGVKGYTEQHVLKNISFKVEEGDFFGIVGRNGSGKSTLLKLISQIYVPDSGKIIVNGKLVPFIELGVGFNPELTGRENIYLNGALLGFSHEEVSAMYDEIVEFAELHDFMDQKLKNYSSGMQVRLAFSIAIKSDASILVLDEVLAVGDADFQRKCYEYFKKLRLRKNTAILVTHDMGAVKEYCNKAIIINDGSIKNYGDPDTIANDYLKLFNRVDNSKKDANDSTRWGNGDVRVVKKKIDIQDKNMTVSFTVRSKINVDNVVLGYRFYDESGAILAGASTVNAMQGASNGLMFKRGETKTIVFTGSNILGTGNYRFGYTIRLADMGTICDDDEYASEFSHTRSESYQPIICPVKVSIGD